MTGDLFDGTGYTKMLDTIYEKGGSPEFVGIEGLGVLYWPCLTDEEKAFVAGWVTCRDFYKEKA